MPNLKKFVALSLGAVCLLSSCNHTVDATGAKKFIKENYSSADTYKGVNKIQLSYTVTCPNDEVSKFNEWVREVATKAGYTGTLKDTSLSFTCKEMSKTSEYYIDMEKICDKRLTESYIDDLEAEKASDSKIIYTTSKKEISYYQKDIVNKETTTGTKETTIIFSETGHARYYRHASKYKMDNKNYSFTQVFTIDHNN